MSSFVHTRTSLVPHAYVSAESVYCILLSLFELKAILMIFSVKTLCFPFLNLCFIFNISLLFLMNFL